MLDLPLLLAGPIVRQVLSDRASIWIAFSEPQSTVTVTLWEGGFKPAGQAAATSHASASVPTRRFGKHLHIALVTVTATLHAGFIYSYDVEFTDASGTESLDSQGLLTNESELPTRRAGVHASAPFHLALGYTAGQLPSFVVAPATREELRLAHGSCRCTNAPEWDAMAFLDSHIKKYLGDADERPQQLFLTGDQIYADDVAAPLLPMLTELGVDLLGGPEKLPLDGEEIQGVTQVQTTSLFAHCRKRLTRRHAYFTSVESDNHLLGFGEFAAMYLAVWGNGVWRDVESESAMDKLHMDISGLEHGVMHALTNWKACLTTPDLKKDHEQELQKQLDYVKEFRAAVPEVARALANTATYMILDDHEVTDDWNFSKQWRTKVLGRPLGKAVIRNALLAYAIFQAWGNEPEAFTHANPPTHNGVILDAAEELFAGDGGPSANVDPALSATLDQRFGLVEDVNEQELAVWNYTVECPDHLVVMLDTRTRRAFTGKHAAPPPKLLGSDEVSLQIPVDSGSKLLFVMSPVPVLEPESFGRLGRAITEIVWDIKLAVKWINSEELDDCFKVPPVSAVEKFDAEGWGGDEVARENLLKQLAAHEVCVILSGDVHCSSSLAMDHWRSGWPTARIVQITSSSVHHLFAHVAEALIRSAALVQRYVEGGLPPVQLAWEVKGQIQVPAGAKLAPARRARMRREPTLVPARGWPQGTSAPLPDWAWRMKLVSDERPTVPYANQLPSLDANANQSDPLEIYRLAAKRHELAAAKPVDHLRRIVFPPNVSLVSIRKVNGEYELTNDLLSRTGPGKHGMPPFANTQHKISLEPTTDDMPELPYVDP